MSEETYRLTPKAFLAIRTNTNLDEFNEIWSEFIAFVQKLNEEDGKDGIPGLVLIDGGHCIAFKEDDNEQD